MSVTRKCRTVLGALNRRFKWESANHIRFICKYDEDNVHSTRMITTAFWNNSRVKILGSKGLEAPTNTTGNARILL